MSSPSHLLVRILQQHRLLEDAQLVEVESTLVVRFPTAPDLMKELIRRDWLTKYQRDQIAR